MASGCAVSDVCKSVWLELKEKKKLRFISFKVNDKFTMVNPDSDEWQIPRNPELKDDPENDTKEALKAVKALLVADKDASQPRWIIGDFDFSTNEATSRSTGKLIMIKWCPDGAKVKARMVFSSSTQGFIKATCGDFQITAVQADCLDEIDDILPRLISGQLK